MFDIFYCICRKYSHLKVSFLKSDVNFRLFFYVIIFFFYLCSVLIQPLIILYDY